MGIARIIIGTLFCLATAVLIVFFVTLGYNVANYTQLGTPAQYQVIFALLLDPITAVSINQWSVIAALGVGALIGGLISKSPLGGLAVGLVSFAAIFMLFLGVSIGFDVNLWITWVSNYGSNVAGELALCAGILGGVGALGGKLTAEND